MNQPVQSSPIVSEDVQKEKMHPIKRMLKFFSYPIAALSGLYAASVSVHNSTYNTAKTLGAFDDILEKATPKSRMQIQQRINGNTGKEEFFAQALDTKINYQNAADARLEHLGVNSFRKKWNYMTKAARQTATIEGLTVAGIAVGALLTIADSKTLTDLLEKTDGKSDEQTP